MPGDGRTPIVPDDDRPLFPQAMDESNHISGQLENVIGLDWRRPIGLAVAALIRSHHVESSIGQYW